MMLMSALGSRFVSASKVAAGGSVRTPMPEAMSPDGMVWALEGKTYLQTRTTNADMGTSFLSRPLIPLFDFAGDVYG
jgi:hypothetical protein